MLSELGRREEALAAAQEAADLYRGLAAERPDAFTPDLAMSLNNLANWLSELGRREEALAAAQEAADLYRGLAAARPDAFTPDLAMSLNNLAKCFGPRATRGGAGGGARGGRSLSRAHVGAAEAFTRNAAISLSTLAVSCRISGARRRRTLWHKRSRA